MLLTVYMQGGPKKTKSLSIIIIKLYKNRLHFSSLTNCKEKEADSVNVLSVPYDEA